jgi:hypothetical protein
VDYELDLLSSWIHNLFHVSFLKKVLGHTMPIQAELLELDEEGKLILKPKNYKWVFSFSLE